MAWRGYDPAIEVIGIDDLRSYIRSLNYSSWRPSGQVVHNTASPTLYQYWNSVPPAQRMANLKHHYYEEMGWSAGPHCFIDGKSYWLFTPFNVKGVHSPSWNGTHLGWEHVGDYEKESATSGMGLKVQEMGHALCGECAAFFGWDPSNILYHKQDPQTTHDCPGKNMEPKSTYISAVQEYMGEGGDDGDKPSPPRHGVVTGVASGDKLNIRATSSSSAPVIGYAENGDELTIVNEAMNGSTKWLRFRVGRDEGPAVAVHGWVSAQFVVIKA